MNAKARDELLIRIDERQREVAERLKKIDEHLKELNASNLKNNIRIVENVGRINCLAVQISRQWWLIGIVLSAILGLKVAGII
jgi:flagellar biosynthesis/type III secretory pathway chaperone